MNTNLPEEQSTVIEFHSDVTVLVNGLQLVHIELKWRGAALEEAFNQIARYQEGSFCAGSKYCVFTSDKMLLVMRPYQIAATEKILHRIRTAKKKGSIAQQMAERERLRVAMIYSYCTVQAGEDGGAQRMKMAHLLTMKTRRAQRC